MDWFNTVWVNLEAWWAGLADTTRDLIQLLAGFLGISLAGVLGWFAGLGRWIANLLGRPPWPLHSNLGAVADREARGRDRDLRKLDGLMRRRRGAAITPAAALSATGGMGKTTLARLYARTRGGRYEGVWVFDCETPAISVVSGADALAAELAMPEVKLDGPDRVRRVWEALRKRRKPWLLVFDNAPDHAAISPWLPEGATLRLLITSRADDFPAARIATLGVDALAPRAAAEVIEAEAERRDDRQGALRLAEALGRLPLALVVAGAYARDSDQSFAEVEAAVAALADQPQPADYAGGEPRKMVAMLDLSLDRIDPETQQGADEWALLRLLPWLAPEGIDAKLVLDIADAEDDEYAKDLDPALRALAGDAARLHGAISRLARRGLVTAQGEGPARTAVLHRVTVLLLRARDAGARDARRAAAAAAVAAGYPSSATPQDRRYWPDCVRLNGHVAALAAAAPGAAAPLGPPETAAMDLLFNQAALYWGEQAATETALAYAREALRLRRARLGPDHPETGIGHDTLGGRLSYAGLHAEAVAERERALEIARAQGPGYAPLGKMLSNLTVALAGLARTQPPEVATTTHARRVDLLREASAVVRARLARPARHVDLATTLNNLASTHAAQGRLGRAICFAAAAARCYEDGTPEGDHRRGFACNTLGVYLLQARRPAAAEDPLARALAIREAALPDDHPHRRGTADWLAVCRFALGWDAEARALCAAYGLDAAAVARRAKDFRPNSGA